MAEAVPGAFGKGVGVKLGVWILLGLLGAWLGIIPAQAFSKTALVSPAGFSADAVKVLGKHYDVRGHIAEFDLDAQESFKADGLTFSAPGQAGLAEIADRLVREPELNIGIEGYGSGNVRVLEVQVIAVVDALLHAGLPPKRIMKAEIVGMGDSGKRSCIRVCIVGRSPFYKTGTALRRDLFPGSGWTKRQRSLDTGRSKPRFGA